MLHRATMGRASRSEATRQCARRLVRPIPWPARRPPSALARRRRQMRRADTCFDCRTRTARPIRRRWRGTPGIRPSLDRTAASIRVEPRSDASQRPPCDRRVASRSPPVSAISASRSKVSPGPMREVSSAAAHSSFPTNRLPMRSAWRSMAPPAGTPSCWCPTRPRSWTVVCSPAVTTRSVMTTPASAGIRRARSGGISRDRRWSAAPAGSRERSKIRSGVRPMRFQPPGDSSG